MRSSDVVSYKAHNGPGMQNVAERYVHARISIVVSTLRECVHFVEKFCFFCCPLVSGLFFFLSLVFGENPPFLSLVANLAYRHLFLSSFCCFNDFYASFERGAVSLSR